MRLRLSHTHSFRMPSMRPKRVVLACVLACVLAIGIAPSAALAHTDDTNQINPSQMPDNSFLYDTSIYDLLQSNSSTEGKTVQVTGEVVGDLLADTENPSQAWITISSTDPKKPGDISVLIDASDAELIDSYGRYGTTGTIVRVKGTFHVTCPVHEATMDIHADTISAVQEGQTHVDPPNLDKFKWGIVLCAVGTALSVLYFVLRERQR